MGHMAAGTTELFLVEGHTYVAVTLNWWSQREWKVRIAAGANHGSERVGLWCDAKLFTRCGSMRDLDRSSAFALINPKGDRLVTRGMKLSVAPRGNSITALFGDTEQTVSLATLIADGLVPFYPSAGTTRTT